MVEQIWARATCRFSPDSEPPHSTVERCVNLGAFLDRDALNVGVVTSLRSDVALEDDDILARFGEVFAELLHINLNLIPGVPDYPPPSGVLHGNNDAVPSVDASLGPGDVGTLAHVDDEVLLAGIGRQAEPAVRTAVRRIMHSLEVEASDVVLLMVGLEYCSSGCGRVCTIRSISSGIPGAAVHH